MSNWPRAVLFDLDGTLAHSAPDMAHAVDQTLMALDLAPAGIDVVQTWVGDGVGLLLDRALGHCGITPDATLHQRAHDEFLKAYAARLCVDTALYPGIGTLLGTLSQAQVPLGIVTNKPAAFTEPLVEALGIAAHFSICISGDSLAERKPHPMPVLHACEALGVLPRDSVMVGDSPNDAKAAQGANAGAILMTWGYNTGVDLNTLGVDAVLDTADDLTRTLSVWASA